MKRARLIYNPASGKGMMQKELPYVLDCLEKAGYETSAHRTTGKDCAKNAAAAAVLGGFDLIVAAGGDGTICETINGIGALSNRPLFGIIPAGTTNDLAAALGISRNIKSACDVLCGGYSRPIDIGQAGNRYFINVAAFGNLIEVTYEIPSRIKKIIGQAAYYIRGLSQLPFITPKEVRIEYDENVFEGEILLVLICNTTSVGGFRHIAIDSEYDDGLFDVIIFEKMNFPQIVNVGGQLVSGSKLKHAKIHYIKARHIKVESKKNLKLNLDGEFGGNLPIELTNLHNHLTILVPKKKQSNGAVLALEK